MRVHRHTIPVCVPLKALGERFIPYFDSDASSSAEGGIENRPPQDLSKFLRAVRRECVSLHKRIEAIETLKEELARTQGVREVRGLDIEGREAEIEFVDRHIARISIDTDGTIEKVFVRKTPRGETGLRGKAIERMVLGGDGRIESLTARLSDGRAR